MGQIFCEAFWSNGTPVAAAPRTVARKQYERLESLGYRLFSGFEAEFTVVHADTKAPVFSGRDFVVDQSLAANSEWMFDAEKQLASVGVDVCAIHPEYSYGQFECCMAPEFGMKTPDNMIVFKQAFKEILPKYSLQPTFMTRPLGDAGGSSGFHFNHSLWSKNYDECLFYDVSKPNNMSDVMRYWVGGLLKHMPALSAFCSPTTNCHRRLHQPWAPSKQTWGIENRFASLRVKASNEKCCLVENRLPSSASNVYLVVAATIAAGLDGIEHKIEPPPMGNHDDDALLPSLEESFKALEASDVMRRSLGDELITWFLATKRGNEAMIDDFEKEKEVYFRLI